MFGWPVCHDAHQSKLKTHLAVADPLLERSDPGDVGLPTVDTLPLQSFSDRKETNISSSRYIPFNYKYNNPNNR